MKNPKFREIYDQNRNAISEVYSETEESNESLISQFFTGTAMREKGANNEPLSSTSIDNAPSISEHKDVVDVTNLVYGPNSMVSKSEKAREKLISYFNPASLDKDHPNFPIKYEEDGINIEKMMDRYKSLNLKEETPSIIDAKKELLRRISEKWEKFPKKVNEGSSSSLVNPLIYGPEKPPVIDNDKSLFDGTLGELADSLLSLNTISKDLADNIKVTEKAIDDLLKGPVNVESEHKMEILTRKLEEYTQNLKDSFQRIDDARASSSGSTTPTPSTPQITHKDMDNSNLNIENPFNDID